MLAFSAALAEFASTLAMAHFVYSHAGNIIMSLLFDKISAHLHAVKAPSSDYGGSEAPLSPKQQVKKRHAREPHSDPHLASLLEIPMSGSNCVVM
jgi:hypothetical protein